MNILSALAAAALLAARASAAEPSRFGSKPFGVLLLGSEGGREWDKTVEEARKSLGPGAPLEAISGEPDSRDIRRALDRLKAERAQRVVAVPVYLYYEDPRLEQIRYLLGLQRIPSERFMLRRNAHLAGRVIPRAAPDKATPLVMTPALDGALVLEEMLLSRVRDLSREPENEALVLAGEGFGSEKEDAGRRALLERLASKLRKRARLRAARAALLPSPDDRPAFAPPPANRTGRLRSGDEKGAELREAVRDLGRGGRVLVVGVALGPSGSERAFEQLLQGLFCRWSGKALLPDPRMSAWIKAKAAGGLKLPDMVKDRDEGRALPASRAKRIVQ